MDKKSKIISNILWVGSLAVGYIAMETTYNTGKKIIEHVYNDIILKNK